MLLTATTLVAVSAMPELSPYLPFIPDAKRPEPDPELVARLMALQQACLRSECIWDEGLGKQIGHGEHGDHSEAAAPPASSPESSVSEDGQDGATSPANDGSATETPPADAADSTQSEVTAPSEDTAPSEEATASEETATE